MLTIVVHEMLIGSVPNLLGNRTAGIELHTHTLLLRSLSSKDISGHWLLNFSLTKQDFVFGLAVAGLYLDDLATSDHTNVLKLDLNVIIWKDHAS